MGLLDFATGAIEATGFDDIVGGFIGSFTDGTIFSGFEDIISGAVTNAAVTAIAGGDIGRAALFGAAGGAVSGSGIEFGNELGAAVTGYGLAGSNGGNGIVGALSGAAGSYLSDKSDSPTGKSYSSTSQSQTASEPTAGDTTVNAATKSSTATSGLLTEKLQDLGLMTASGDGTLLGKALVAGIQGMASESSAEDLLDKRQEQALEQDENTARLEYEAEQKRIGYFTNNNNFTVTRNG